MRLVAVAWLALLQAFWPHSCVALKLLQLVGFKQHIPHKMLRKEYGFVRY